MKLHKYFRFFLLAGNVWSWVVILMMISNNTIGTSKLSLSVCVILVTYLIGLIKFLGELRPHRRELVQNAPPLGRAVIKSNIEQIEQKVYKTYEFKENRVSEDDWKAFRVMLEDYAKSFLGKYYPTVPIDFEFRLLDQKLDTDINGEHVYLNTYFGAFDNYIYLSDWLVHASIYCDEFSIVVPTLSHELVHYALFKLGKEHRDGQNDFEKELEQIGLPSNYDQKYMGIYVSRIEENGKTIAKIYISKNEHSKLSLGMEELAV